MSSSLNAEQEKAVCTNDRSLLIVAGAGTGKTRVLVEKVIRLLSDGVDGSRIVALTFTNKASDEMRERVQARCSSGHLPFIGTFHALCVSLLREFSSEAGVPEHFSIFDRDACRRVLKRCMKQEGIDSVTPRVMQYAIGQLKVDLSFGEDSDTALFAKRLLPLYDRAMEQEQALDFDDLLVRAKRLLKRNARVREQVRSRYAYLLVDEFQDTDTLQNELLSLLKGPATHIIAVGDTDQTIYSWRGANISHMLSFSERYPPVSTVFLTQNYRSSATILAGANAVIAKNVFRQEKDLITTRPAGNRIVFLPSTDEEGEAERIASEILSLRDSGVPLRDIALLFRVNFQSRALETAMLSHRIPYMVTGARFFDRAEVKDLLAYLTLIQNPHSREAFTRAAGVPRRGIGQRTFERIFSGEEHLLSASMAAKVASFRAVVSQISRVAEQGTVADILREIITAIDYSSHITAVFDNPSDRLREVRELLAFSERFSSFSGRDGVAQLLSEVALSSDQDTLRTHTHDAVRLMTVHAAKGLEFSHVFITGMEEGLFPFLHDEDTNRDEEEERRLLYVAMTRAKDALYCSFARRRGFFGSYRDMQPSSFLSDIPENLVSPLDLTEDSDTHSAEETIAW